MNTVIYRLPEKGIKLDFIQKVKEQNDAERAVRLKRAGTENEPMRPSKKVCLSLKKPSVDTETAASALIQLHTEPVVMVPVNPATEFIERLMVSSCFFP